MLDVESAFHLLNFGSLSKIESLLSFADGFCALAGGKIWKHRHDKPEMEIWPCEFKIAKFESEGSLSLFTTSKGEFYGFGSHRGQKSSENTQSCPQKIDLPKDSGKPLLFSIGGNFSVVQTENRNLFGFGQNDSLQLGDTNAPAFAYSWVQLPSFATDLTQIACGDSFAIALTSNGSVYSWGNNDCGQLGRPVVARQATPSLVPLPDPIVFLSVGKVHSVVLSKNGAVFGWGGNNVGQVLPDIALVIHKPTKIELEPVQQISCGFFHTCALSVTNKLYSWGSNDNGQLGKPSKSSFLTPSATLEELYKDFIGNPLHADFFIPAVKPIPIHSWIVAKNCGFFPFSEQFVVSATQYQGMTFLLRRMYGIPFQVESTSVFLQAFSIAEQLGLFPFCTEMLFSLLETPMSKIFQSLATDFQDQKEEDLNYNVPFLFLLFSWWKSRNPLKVHGAHVVIPSPLPPFVVKKQYEKPDEGEKEPNENDDKLWREFGVLEKLAKFKFESHPIFRHFANSVMAEGLNWRNLKKRQPGVHLLLQKNVLWLYWVIEKNFSRCGV